ncbi:hypothetical protein [Nocardioides sp. 503]|uniref:hypothetical protein n=1 Tax=Nocardioides sp. 503 TaxID=2508326 RepID=UPI00106FBBF4|nr:hypothetical protein [Nocardioides sp. 503]
MPAPARRRHRALVLTLSGGLLLAGLVGTAGPAAAAPVATGQITAGIEFAKLSGSAATCSVPSPGDDAAVPFTSDSGGKTASLSGTATVADSNDAADVTSLTASAKTSARTTAVAGSLRDLDVTSALRARFISAQGFNSSCKVSVQATAATQTAFDVSRPGWLTLVATKGQGGYGVLAVAGPTGVFQTYALRVRSSDSYRFFLPEAGQYQISVQVAAPVETPDGPDDPTDESVSLKVHGEFRTAGVATGNPVGAGASFLALGSQRSCAADTLAATFTAQARKVKTATIYVNGRRVATVRKPKAGRVVTLTHLSDTQPVSVRAVLARKAGKPVTVTRSYLACS